MWAAGRSAPGSNSTTGAGPRRLRAAIPTSPKEWRQSRPTAGNPAGTKGCARTWRAGPATTRRRLRERPASAGRRQSAMRRDHEFSLAGQRVAFHGALLHGVQVFLGRLAGHVSLGCPVAVVGRVGDEQPIPSVAGILGLAIGRWPAPPYAQQPARSTAAAINEIVVFVLVILFPTHLRERPFFSSHARAGGDRKSGRSGGFFSVSRRRFLPSGAWRGCGPPSTLRSRGASLAAAGRVPDRVPVPAARDDRTST